MDVRPLLYPAINWERLAPELDEVGDQVRLATVRELGQDELARLFEGAAGHDALTPADLAPLETTPTSIVHDGHHPGALFPRFTTYVVKWKDADGADEIVGYHEHAALSLGGPAYFRALPSDDGSVTLDYARAPAQVPSGWPAPSSPGKKYQGRSDVLRRVSASVTVGRPVRAGKPIDEWFALVRKTGRF